MHLAWPEGWEGCRDRRGPAIFRGHSELAQRYLSAAARSGRASGRRGVGNLSTWSIGFNSLKQTCGGMVFASGSPSLLVPVGELRPSPLPSYPRSCPNLILAPRSQNLPSPFHFSLPLPPSLAVLVENFVTVSQVHMHAMRAHAHSTRTHIHTQTRTHKQARTHARTHTRTSNKTPLYSPRVQRRRPGLHVSGRPRPAA